MLLELGTTKLADITDKINNEIKESYIIMGDFNIDLGPIETSMQ